MLGVSASSARKASDIYMMLGVSTNLVCKGKERVDLEIGKERASRSWRFEEFEVGDRSQLEAGAGVGHCHRRKGSADGSR